MIETVKKVAVNAVESTNPVNVLYGIVTRDSPLEIQVHQKLTLTSEFLILGRNVTDHEIEMTVDHTTESSLSTYDLSHSHRVSGNTENALGSHDLSHSHGFDGETDEGGEDDPHTHLYSDTTNDAGGSLELAHGHSYSGTSDSAGETLNLEHTHSYKGRKTFKVHNGLKSGEKVILLRVQGGNQYVVLDRVVS